MGANIPPLPDTPCIFCQNKWASRRRAPVEEQFSGLSGNYFKKFTRWSWQHRVPIETDILILWSMCGGLNFNRSHIDQWMRMFVSIAILGNIWIWNPHRGRATSLQINKVKGEEKTFFYCVRFVYIKNKNLCIYLSQMIAVKVLHQASFSACVEITLYVCIVCGTSTSFCSWMACHTNCKGIQLVCGHHDCGHWEGFQLKTAFHKSCKQIHQPF